MHQSLWFIDSINDAVRRNGYFKICSDFEFCEFWDHAAASRKSPKCFGAAPHSLVEFRCVEGRVPGNESDDISPLFSHDLQ